MSRFLRHWGPALLWTALLFGVSSRPTLPVDLHSNLDKLAHFGAYTVSGLLLARGQVLSGIHVLWAVLFGILLGGLDEIYQGFVPGRFSELADWVADSLGVLAGVSIYHLLLRWWTAARSTPPRRHVPEPLAHE